MKNLEATRQNTLRNTIHAKFGKNVLATDAVHGALINRGYVRIDGTKVTYALLAA